jgi:glyoxylase-like metal-dependent hydrolase (beta-lactamase superfamily II)
MLLEDQLSDVLRKFRYGRKISLKTLEQSTNISAGELRAFEAGDEIPADNQLNALGTALGFDPLIPGKLHFHPERTPDPKLPDWIHPVKENYHGMDVWCYIVDLPVQGASINKKCCVLIDTGSATDILKNYIKQERIEIKGILLTHGHEDHGGGADHLSQNIPVYLNDADIPLMETHIKDLPFILPPEEARDLLEPFGITRFEITPMPGHTKGSIAYRINNALFVGDGIFCGSAGKPWTPEDFDDELHSIRALLDSYPEELLILSGHGPFTTVGIEKEANPFYHSTF